MNSRILHFVFKIGDRNATANFFRNTLLMKFLRHEEFSEGCAASCNGPYDGKWSKSMVGYGPEDSHFVMELTYNYGICAYPQGNDFLGIHINSHDVYNSICKTSPFDRVDSNAIIVKSPDGQPFYVYNKQKTGDPVCKVSLASSDLAKTKEYWSDLLKLNVVEASESSIVLAFHESQCHLEFIKIDGPVLHEKAYGRVAFACSRELLPGIQERVSNAGHVILKPLVSLDTPGKATVEVVILADPDGHEICFVGDEAFRELSAVDPNADSLLDAAMDVDKSTEWFAKRGGKTNA